MKARKASEIKLSIEERETLERYVRRRKTGRSMAQRAEIILRAAAGENNCEIARGCPGDATNGASVAGALFEAAPSWS